MRLTRMVLGCLIAAALCGCAGLTAAEKQGLTQFGTSTSSYADKVNTATTAAQNDILQMRLDELGFRTDVADKNFENRIMEDKSLAQYLESAPPEKPEGKQSPSGAKPKKADEKQPPSLSEHIAMMNKLALTLKEYGQALVDLANYGDPSARMNTIQDIATKSNTIMQSPVAQAQANAIGKMLAIIGNEIIEAVKKKDIKEIVKKFSPAVNSAVDLLRPEFEGEMEGTLVWNYDHLIGSYERRLPDPTKGTEAEARLAAQAALKQFEPKDYQCIDIDKIKDPKTEIEYIKEVKVKDPKKANAIAAAYVAFCAAAETRREIAVGRAKVLNMRARCKAMKDQGLEATKALKEANDKMTAALEKGTLSVTDIQDFAKKAVDFVQAINSIK